MLSRESLVELFRHWYAEFYAAERHYDKQWATFCMSKVVLYTDKLKNKDYRREA